MWLCEFVTGHSPSTTSDMEVHIIHSGHRIVTGGRTHETAASCDGMLLCEGVENCIGVLGITIYNWKSGFGIGQGTISNTIIWGSTIADVAIVDPLAPTKFSYSCVETGSYTDSIDMDGGGKLAELTGVGLTRKGAGCQDPLFVNAAGFDFHVRSLAGHFDAATQSWVNDTETSPCIDAGDPITDYALESAPNGGRVNLGAYGGTVEASRSP